MSDTKTTKVITGECRLSYAHVFEKHANSDDQEPKYSVVLLIPKSDRATLKKIRDAQQAALEKGKTTKFGGRIPPKWVDTLHDGDEEKDTEEAPEYAGHMYMTVSAQQAPGIIDRDRQPILDSREVYSGCYARASINAYPFNTSGNKGVSFGLNNLQKLRDGEVLGGAAAKAEDDFADDLAPDDGEDVL